MKICIQDNVLDSKILFYIITYNLHVWLFTNCMYVSKRQIFMKFNWVFDTSNNCKLNIFSVYSFLLHTWSLLVILDKLRDRRSLTHCEINHDILKTVSWKNEQIKNLKTKVFKFVWAFAYLHLNFDVALMFRDYLFSNNIYNSTNWHVIMISIKMSYNKS